MARPKINKYANDPKTIASFDPTWVQEDDVIVADRSTLQQWADCPAAARLIEAGEGLPVQLAAHAGSEAHQAISIAVGDYIDSGGTLTRGQIVEQIMIGARVARADVQTLTVESLKYGAWAIANILCQLNASDVMRFDGGAGRLSGQLSHDLNFGQSVVRVTGEIDLMHASPSPEMIHVRDWKTGRKRHTSQSVFESFQSQTYAWLVLVNYPDVQAVAYQVLDTFSNQDTHAVMFRREKHFQNIDQRIRSAAVDMLTGRVADQAELRPALEKCRICPAVLKCPVADATTQHVAKDSAAAVAYLVALEAMQDAWRESLLALVDERGKDLQGPGGVYFGRQGPRQERTPPPKLYKLAD